MATATVFQSISNRGKSESLSLAANQRYDVKRFLDLVPSGLAHAVGSAELSHGPPGPGDPIGDAGAESSLYLFAGTSQVQNGDYRRSIPYWMLNMRSQFPFIQDLHGDFLRLTLPGGNTPFIVTDLRADLFYDRTTSLLLVNRWKNGKTEQTISARTTFTLPWNLALMGAIPLIEVVVGGVAIARIQDPVFTWVAFPRAQRNLTDSEVYMVLSQWFVFHASGIGMNVWLSFYFHFEVNNSRLALNLVDLDRYVWPGTGQGQMMQAIDGNKASIISALQTFSTAVFQSGAVHSACDDVYLLPGTQPDAKATRDGSTLGDALDDVTVVLENPRSI